MALRNSLVLYRYKGRVDSKRCTENKSFRRFEKRNDNLELLSKCFLKTAQAFDSRFNIYEELTCMYAYVEITGQVSSPVNWARRH